jgi:peptidoglycan/xylan/chitin deacetylase (PgdA/CDA1 family)
MMASSPFDKASPSAAACAGLILMYHRISVTPTDPWALGVSPEHFEEHLEVLQRHYDPVTLAEIASATRSGRAITVTFDDGYVDNLSVAAPLLARYEVPATVFVTTGSIGSCREYWWDELERALLSPDELPDDFAVASSPGIEKRSLGAARFYTRAERQSDQVWIARKQGSPSSRLAFFREIHGRLMPAPDTERRAALEQIMGWAGQQDHACTDLRCMSREELRELTRHELIEIGAHTTTHPQLPSLSAPQQLSEIIESRTLLQTITGETVASFSYPYGLFTDESKQIVRAAGFSRACSTLPRGVIVGDDAWALPRIKVGDWDGATFEKALALRLAGA